MLTSTILSLQAVYIYKIWRLAAGKSQELNAVQFVLTFVFLFKKRVVTFQHSFLHLMTYIQQTTLTYL